MKAIGCMHSSAKRWFNLLPMMVVMFGLLRAATALGETGLARPTTGFAAGAFHSLVLKTDGSLWAWGSNGYGQLGTGNTENAALPSRVDAGYSSIVAGRLHSVGLKTDGSLWAWGENGWGQLGDGTTDDAHAPKLIATGFIAIAAGQRHTVALKADGSLWTWGSNTYGQIGDGTNTDAHLPKAIGTGFTEIAAGGFHTVARKADGSVWAWGRNGDGQVGDGSSVDVLLPQKIESGFGAIAAGGFHTLALKFDGSLWAWGYNADGELGDGTSTNSLLPKAIATGFKSIAAGYFHTLALKQDSSLWAWGYNGWGQLGDGGDVDSLLPKRIGANYAAVTAGMYHSLAITVGGGLWAWGENVMGQIGDGTFATRFRPSLTINDTANGAFKLGAGIVGALPADKVPPFYIVASGGITSTNASVSTSTQFNPVDQGRSGAVYITASVPRGSLGSTSIGKSVPVTGVEKVSRPSPLAGITQTGFVLIQLTPSGWQTVLNGQLIPYASGVLGDQLAAQTILSNTDTTNLKGAEFCVGYGSSAQDMVNSGNIRTVATIPGATATTSCVVGGTISVVINLVPGWNLLGNPISQSIAVADKFGDASKVTSVWKWDTAVSNWQFYAPGMTAEALQSFAASQGYSVLSDISPGDGYWVNAKAQADLGTLSGTTVNLRQSSLASGWNLVATASNIAPSEFNRSLSSTPPTAGQIPINMTSLWAWDAAQARWYFYAPSLESQGGDALGSYVSAKGYLDFAGSGRTVGNGDGIWVNRP